MFTNPYDAAIAQRDASQKRATQAGAVPWYRQGAVSGSLIGQDLGRSLGGMLGMQTPEQAKQNKIEEIMGQYGEGAKSYEQLLEIADSFRDANMLDLWEQTMGMAEKMKTTKTTARKTLTGDDGLKYYLDTGERVFPGQTSKPSVEGIKIPEGYQLIQENNALRMTPIPGSPAEAKLVDVDLSNKAKNQGVIRSSALVTKTIGKLRKLIKSSSTDDKYKSFDKKDETDDYLNPIFGLTGVAASIIPGSNRKDAENLAVTIKSHIGFDRLDRMRKESPTGGALGQVSEMELTQLNATLGSLAFAQSEEQFLYVLNQIEREYAYIMQKIQDTGDGTFTQGKPKNDPLNIGL